MSGAALSQGRRTAVAGQVQISWQAQHFRKVRYRFCGRHSTFARSGTDFVAGTILSQGQVQISRQAQHFSKVRYRFAADAGLSQGAVQVSRPAQHFRKRYQFRGRRSTFARYGAFSQTVAKKIQRYKHEEKKRENRERQRERERKKERKKERKRVMIEEVMIQQRVR